MPTGGRRCQQSQARTLIAARCSSHYIYTRLLFFIMATTLPTTRRRRAVREMSSPPLLYTASSIRRRINWAPGAMFSDYTSVRYRQRSLQRDDSVLYYRIEVCPENGNTGFPFLLRKSRGNGTRCNSGTGTGIAIWE